MSGALLVMFLLWVITILVGPIFLPFVAFVPVIAVIEENTTFMNAITRSIRLGEGYYGRTLFVLLFFVGVGIALSVVWFFLIGVMLPENGAEPPDDNRIFEIIGVTGIGVARTMAPWAIAAMVLLYYDLRSRKEAYDFRPLLEDLWRG